MEKMNVIIFSKDRACQLDALYRSFVKHAKERDHCQVTVIWKASNETFEAGYRLFEKSLGDNENVKMVKQTTFKENVMTAMNPYFKLTMFLVDDIMFKQDFSLEDHEVDLVQSNAQILTTSLRLWNGIIHCYATNMRSDQPRMTKGCVWKWRDAQGDWGYPFSVDGNIYRTDFITERIVALNFNNPNELEAQLTVTSLWPNTPEHMCCYAKGSKLLNIPANRVQEQYKNRHAHFETAEHLNKRYMDGFVISLSTVENCENDTVHIELPYEWVRVR